MPAPPELLTPTSPAEAAAAFGDGSDVTVMAGGTILLPELTYGRLRPARVLMLGRAGLSGVDNSNGVVRIGAGTPVADLHGCSGAARDRGRPHRRPRDPRGRHDRGKPLRDRRRRRPRAAISRRRCSRSARASPRSGRAARRPRTSRSSSRPRAGGSCSPSTCRAASRSATRASTVRTRTTTRCSRSARSGGATACASPPRVWAHARGACPESSRPSPEARRRPKPPRTRPKGWSFRPTLWRRPGTESKCCRCSSQRALGQLA